MFGRNASEVTLSNHISASLNQSSEPVVVTKAGKQDDLINSVDVDAATGPVTCPKGELQFSPN